MLTVSILPIYYFPTVKPNLGKENNLNCLTFEGI